MGQPLSQAVFRGKRCWAFMLIGVSLAFVLGAGAADLGVIVAEAAKYESGLSAVPLRQIEQAVKESAGNPAQRAQVEAALVKLLGPECTYEAKRFACVQLAIIGGEASLPAIADLLKQPETVGIGCLALGSNPSPKVNELLRKSLAASQGEIRRQLIDTLADRRDVLAVKDLAALLDGNDAGAALAAISALGKIASPEAVEQLTKLLAQGEAKLGAEKMRAACLASLVAADLVPQTGKTGMALYNTLLAKGFPLEIRRAALEGMLRSDPDGGERRAMGVLQGEDAALKTSAIVHVRRIKGAGISAAFAKVFPKLTPEEQVLLVESLAMRNDDAARAAITAQLSATDERVRRAAVMAFATIGDVGSVAELAKAMQTAKAGELQNLELAMASLQGGLKVDQAILDLLKTGKDLNRAGLINVLARRGATAAVPMLLAEVRGAEVNGGRAAARALGKLAGANDLQSLLDQLGSITAAPVRSEFEAALAKVIERSTDTVGRSRLVAGALAKASAAESRAVLIALLPICGGAPALEAAKGALNDPAAGMRTAAIRALADWPDASAVDTLLEVAQAASQNTERILCLRGAVRMLGIPGPYSGRELGLRFQKVMALARNAGEKKLVLGSLPVIGDTQVLAMVEQCLSQPEVQAEAIQAAMRLAPGLCGVYRDETRALLQKVIELPAAGDVKAGAAELRETIGKFGEFITAWNVAGIYEKTGKNGQALFEEVFPPEQPEAPGVKWQILPAGNLKARPWQLDLEKVFGGNNRVAYAQTFVYSATAQEAQLELGSDDGIKAWINGQVVLGANRGGDVIPGSEKAKVKLNQGWNRILLKVTQWSSGWGFCARLAKPDGASLPGLQISVDQKN